jgi:uroporphyrin-III C-methyltransferase
MGLSKIKEIMTLFASHGKGETPVAVIQNGTLPTQKNVVGTVSTVSGISKRLNNLDPLPSSSLVKWSITRMH